MFNLKEKNMFYHSKELQFKARVSKPDPRFAQRRLELLEMRHLARHQEIEREAARAHRPAHR